MRLLRALPERFRRRAKRTFARRETDVDRLRLGYKPQKFYPPTKTYAKRSAASATPLPASTAAIMPSTLSRSSTICGLVLVEANGVNEVVVIGELFRDEADERFARRLFE